MHAHEIQALVHAHAGRARPVAFLHVLRQRALEPADHAFLLAHVAELGASDLLRWRSRCEPGFTGVVLRELARRACADPVAFRHEVLDAPRLDLVEDEWRELADTLRGKIPDEIHALVVARGGPRPRRPAPERQVFPVVVEGEDDWIAPADVDPGGQLGAVTERARRTADPDERANLLARLEQADAPRAELVAVALAPLRPGWLGLGLVTWIARTLSTRAAWERHGQELFRALLERGAHAEIIEIVTLVVSALPRATEADEARVRGVLEVVHHALGATLVERAREAMLRRDDTRATAALSALVCLDPPSRLSRAVRDLRRIDAPGVSGAALDLLAVCERMVRYSHASDASLEGVVAACHALADGASR